MIEEKLFWKNVLGAEVAETKVAPLMARALAPSGPTAAAAASHEPFADDVNSPASPEAPAACVASSSANPKIDDIGMRALQNALQFIQPLEHLRYKRCAMSMSWNGCAIVDGDGFPHTFGGAPNVRFPKNSKFVDVACGDTFISVLAENGDVYVAGSLDTGNNQYLPDTSDSEPLRGLAHNGVIIAGSTSRLFTLSKSYSVRPLSNISASTKTMHPSRPCKYIALGLNDDLMMIGHDNILYKITASSRAVSTPRRVMSMANMGVSKVASGHGFHLIIDLCGRLYSFGRNKKGQLGNGCKQDSMRKPYLHEQLLKYYFVDIACGETHSIALTADGHVFGCGANQVGQIGLGMEKKEVLTMTEIPLPLPCLGIAAGPMGCMFALMDGSIYSCGSNECGQVGHQKTSRIIFAPMEINKTTKVGNGRPVGNGVMRRSIYKSKGALAPETAPASPQNDGVESICTQSMKEPYGEPQKKTESACCCVVS